MSSTVLQFVRATKFSSGPRRDGKWPVNDVRAGDRVISDYGTAMVQDAHRGMELALLNLDNGHKQLALFETLSVIKMAPRRTVRLTITDANGFVSPAYAARVEKNRRAGR